MKLNDLKKIDVGDFPEENQEFVGKLAFILNPLLEQLTNAFTKNIDFDNLNQEVITFDVTINADGTPKGKLEIKTSTRTRPQGLTVIRADNLTLDGTVPTATPFITFTTEGKNIIVQKITGIPADKKYRLTMISYG